MPKSFVLSKIKTCQTEDNVDMSRYQSRSTSALRGNNSGIETSISLTYLSFILFETYNSKTKKRAEARITYYDADLCFR